jgi:hypothetical protein
LWLAKEVQEDPNPILKSMNASTLWDSRDNVSVVVVLHHRGNVVININKMQCQRTLRSKRKKARVRVTSTVTTQQLSRMIHIYGAPCIIMTD